MKKSLFTLAISALLLSSCGTVFQGGKATAYQKTKPATGQPARQIKTGALIGNLFFPIGYIFDFSNGKMYRKEAK